MKYIFSSVVYSYFIILFQLILLLSHHKDTPVNANTKNDINIECRKAMKIHMFRLMSDHKVEGILCSLPVTTPSVLPRSNHCLNL